MKKVDWLNDQLYLRAGGDRQAHAAALAEIRDLPDEGDYDQRATAWTAPASPQNVQYLKDRGWVFPLDMPGKPIRTPAQYGNPDDEILTGIPDDCRPFQAEAVQYARAAEDRSLIKLPPGSGKTAIGAFWAVQDWEYHKKPVLIVCPAGSKEHWKREFEKWTVFCAVVCEGLTPDFPIGRQFMAYVINPEILMAWSLHLCGRFSALIVDEPHLSMANPETLAVRAAFRLVESIPRRLFLTGTPIRNHPDGFWPTLHMIDDKRFPTHEDYRDRYCGRPVENHNRLTWPGSSNEDELHELIKPFMFSRTRVEILPDLPKKNKVIYTVAPKAGSQYLVAEAEAIEAIRARRLSTDDEEAELQALSATAYTEKREETLDLVDSILEDEGEKVVVMCWHHAVIDDLMRYYPDALRIDGRVAPSKRQAIVDEFNTNPEKRVMICNIQAGGVTFSMTGAHNMVFAELCRNPTDAEQAEDRILRLTTVAEQVNYFYIVVEGSVEEGIIHSLDHKARVNSRILDGEKKSYFQKTRSVDYRERGTVMDVMYPRKDRP